MRILTDAPGLAEAFLPAATLHRWRRDGGLAPFDAAVVSALGGAAVWGIDLPTWRPFYSTIVIQSDAVVSQFDALDRVIAEGRSPGAGVACLALNGSRFHGQRSRQWAGARGNLHACVALPIGLSAARVGVGLSTLPAVAVREAIAEATGRAVVPTIKWVNDIVIGERKLGGVLTAAHTRDHTIDDVVWGIGVNVAIAPAIVATPFVRATTCLREQPGGRSTTLPRLFWALLGAIVRRHHDLLRAGSAALFSPYRSASIVVGRRVQVWEEAACPGDDPADWGPPFAQGVVADIAEDLSLGLHGQPGRVGRGRLALQPFPATPDVL